MSFIEGGYQIGHEYQPYVIAGGVALVVAVVGGMVWALMHTRSLPTGQGGRIGNATVVRN